MKSTVTQKRWEIRPKILKNTNRKSYVLCTMALSSMTLEHVSRSNQEMLCWNYLRGIYVCSSCRQQRCPIMIAPPWEFFPWDFLAFAEVCALWLLCGYDVHHLVFGIDFLIHFVVLVSVLLTQLFMHLSPHLFSCSPLSPFTWSLHANK